MALLKPDPTDLQKIHREVNQLVHQRFMLTTVAISVFGVLLAWLVPRTTPDPNTNLGGFTYLISTILCVMLCSIFLLSHLLKNMIRILTSYLRITKASPWEVAWKKYRMNPYTAYTKPQALLFLLLNSLALLFPFIFAGIFNLNLKPYVGLTCLIAVGLSVELVILSLGLFGCLDSEATAERRWTALNSNDTNGIK